MSALFQLWLVISTQLVLSNCVFQIHEPNIPKVNGTSNEYYFFTPSQGKIPEFTLVCDGPVLMRWKLSGLMTSQAVVHLTFNSGGYRATFKTRGPNSHSTGFFTCEAHEAEHRQSNPPSSIYVYVNSEHDGPDLIGHLELPEKGRIDTSELLPSMNPNGCESLLDKYIQVKDTTEFKKSKCLNLLIPCRLSNPEVEVTLKGESYDNNDELFLDAAYDGKRGFSLTYCGDTIKVFVCRTKKREVTYCWRPLPGIYLKKYEKGWNETENPKTENVSHIFPFPNSPFNISCAGDSSITMDGNVNSSEVYVEEHFPPEGRFTHSATVQLLLPTEIQYSGNHNVTCKDTDSSHKFSIHGYDLKVYYWNRFTSYWKYNSDCKMYTCFNTDNDVKLTNWPCLNEIDCQGKMERAKMGCDFQSLGSLDKVHMGAHFKAGRIFTLDPFPAGFFYCRNSVGGHINKYFTGINGILYFLDYEVVPEEAIIDFSWTTTSNDEGLITEMSIEVRYSTYLFAPWATLYIQGEYIGIKELERISPSQGFYIQIDIDADDDPSLKNTVNYFEWDFVYEEGMTELVFCVQMRNETGQRNFTSTLSWEELVTPKIINSKYNYDYYLGETGSHKIMCDVEGYTWNIQWKRISLLTNATASVYETYDGTLLFPAIVPEIAGKYECTAFSYKRTSNDSKVFTVMVKETPVNLLNLMWILIAAVMVLCLFVFLCVYYKRREKNLTKNVRTLTLQELEDFFKGAASNTKPFFRQEVDAEANAVRMPYNDVFEINPDDIHYDTSNLIGQGAFGLVYRANMKLGQKAVAVKTVHQNVSPEVFKATLSELKILMYVGYHPHITEFIGAITTDVKNLDVKLVLEYCENGDMNRYLRKMTQEGLDLDSESSSHVETTKQLLKWLVGIAFGMEHLAKRKIIHGDLATRNILLNSTLDPKITDFGLSSKSMDYSAYVKKGKSEPLPWRWMALESLTQFTFSSASDVWSFGVTAWEMFSFGKTPYPHRTWDESFVQALHDGMRLLKPEICTDEIFAEILSCWNENKQSRADISTLKVKFEGILNNI